MQSNVILVAPPNYFPTLVYPAAPYSAAYYPSAYAPAPAYFPQPGLPQKDI